MKNFLYLLLSIPLFAGSFISTGYRGSFDYRLFEEILPNTSFYQKETKGDLENLRDIFKKENVSLGVVEEDILNDLSKDDFKAAKNLTIISPLYKASIVIITDKKSSINSIKDLSNIRVITDLKGSGAYYTLLKFEELYSITPEIYNMKIDDALKYLFLKKADAIFYIGSLEKFKNKNVKIVPILSSIFKIGSFKFKNKTIKTNYLDKFLVTTTKKAKNISKKDIRILLQNLILRKRDFRDYICGYDLKKLRIDSQGYIYFVCSENIGKNPLKRREIKKEKITIPNKLYYDNIEEITIYPMALKNQNFSFMGTSYIIEKRKLDNAVKLLKENLKNDPKTRVYIIGYGEAYEADSNVNMVYRFFKKAHIPRSAILKRVEPLKKECENRECLFKNTIIRFKLL